MSTIKPAGPGHATAWAAVCLGAALIAAPGRGADQDAPAASPTPPPPKATEAADAEADKAWRAVTKATRPPAQPEAWSQRKPTAEERAEYRKQMAEAAVKAADAAKDFYTRFATHPKAAEAKKIETQMLQTASRMGSEAASNRVAAGEDERAKDPNLSEDERVQMRARSIQRAAMAREGEGHAAVIAEFEKGARALLKEFPKHSIPYQMLISVAADSDGDQARKIAEEIRDNPAAPDEARQSARGLLKKFEALGKPLVLKFTALDGREIETAKLKGKVVLIDFWATWCGPCVAEIPKVKAAYEKLHPKGFEIVGISFDQKKEALTEFIEKEQMRWPQYFDGEGWRNKFGQEFGIESIPTMWLVDKKGILRDQNARGELEEKAGKLLAEP